MTAFLIFFPAVLAAGMVLLRMKRAEVNGPFGPANWSYSESWASSLTLVGALLGTVLAASVLPEKLDLFSKAGYSAFNVFFGMLVLVAPLAYAAGQIRVENDENKKQQYKGTTFAFGLASVATLWGVFGELLTVGLLFREIEKAGSLSTRLVGASFFILSLIGLATILYAWRRMRQILESDPAPPHAGLAPVNAPGVNTWSLL